MEREQEIFDELERYYMTLYQQATIGTQPPDLSQLNIDDSSFHLFATFNDTVKDFRASQNFTATFTMNELEAYHHVEIEIWRNEIIDYGEDLNYLSVKVPPELDIIFKRLSRRLL
eukprot:456315_1